MAGKRGLRLFEGLVPTDPGSDRISYAFPFQMQLGWSFMLLHLGKAYPMSEPLLPLTN